MSQPPVPEDGHNIIIASLPCSVEFAVRCAIYRVFVVAIDDFPREFYAGTFPDHTQYSSSSFLKRVVDEGPYETGYACSGNGKAERVIRALMETRYCYPEKLQATPGFLTRQYPFPKGLVQYCKTWNGFLPASARV
ncbi:MAG TPA: hypothetical protein ENK04_09335 [Gammaproteobacteria bacterium]|nr:hypothetical protein [Gammaproteobacteria bacterium]